MLVLSTSLRSVLDNRRYKHEENNNILDFYAELFYNH